VRLKEEIMSLKAGRVKQEARERELLQDIERYRKESLQSVGAIKEDALKMVDEAKFAMFKQLMDAFEQERKVLEQAHQHTQRLLAQAAKVLSFSLLFISIFALLCIYCILPIICCWLASLKLVQRYF
jgi:cellobiose-specific phosphotransferase system component IIA